MTVVDGEDPTRSGRRTAGDRLVLVGAAVFAVGVVAAIAVLAPFLVGGAPLPSVAYLLALLAPLGFGLALLGLVLAARKRR